MKAILIWILSAFSGLVAQAQTWTVHAVKDNYTDAYVVGPLGFYPDGFVIITWCYDLAFDWDWDRLNPENAYSGVYPTVWVGGENDGSYVTTTSILGWSSSFTVEDLPIEGVTLDTSRMNICVTITGPAPDYFGGWQTVNIYGTQNGGEWWLDFGSDGIIRTLTYQPDDFGKWAWDGSINPSWVEPLAKKGHGKGRK